MSYIGQGLPADTFQGFTTDKFTGDGTANKTFTLTKEPFSEDTILVTIDGVVQEPTDDFTVSGTTLTLVGTAANNAEVNVTHMGGPLPIGGAAELDLNGASDKLILDADGDTTISADTDDQIDFKVGGTDIMSLTATTATINDGTTITVADNTDNLTLTSTDADENNGPNLRLYRNSSSPADNDLLAYISIDGRNDNSEDVTYARIQYLIKDASDGTEDAQIDIPVMQNGTRRSRFKSDNTETVFNEDGVDIDFRVEGDTFTDLFVVDAGNDQVSAGSNSNLSCSLGVLAAGERAMFVGQTLNQDTSVAIWKNVYASGGNSATMIQFTNSGNTEVGSIKSTGSATSFNTSSDYRLKENVDYTWDATTRLKQLKPARFNWIADDTNTLEDGFLAHEVSSIVPEAITGTKDAAITLTKAVIGEHGNVIAENIEESAWTAGKADGTYDANTTWHASKVNPIYQQIDLGKLVPLLVKTVQEQEARIKALEDA
jgi:hypothetical protein